MGNGSNGLMAKSVQKITFMGYWAENVVYKKRLFKNLRFRTERDTAGRAAGWKLLSRIGVCIMEMLHKKPMRMLYILPKIKYLLRIILTNCEDASILGIELNRNSNGLLLVGRQNQILQKLS